MALAKCQHAWNTSQAQKHSQQDLATNLIATFSSLASIVPEPSVSKRSKASLRSNSFCRLLAWSASVA